MKLEDFEEASTSTFEDFETDDATVIPNTALKSIKNRAAMSVGISEAPEQTATQYESAIKELEAGGSSETVESINKQAQSEVYEFSKESLIDGLLEPQISDEVKLGMADRFNEIKATPVSTQELFIEKNIVEDGGEQTEEQVVVRSQLADLVKPYFDWKKGEQLLRDSNEKQLPPSVAVALVDMVEVYLLPTAYGKQHKDLLGSILAHAKGEDTTTFMDNILTGEVKFDMRQMVESLPYDKRIGFQNQLIEIVNNENGIYLKDDNDFARYEFTREVILGEDYSSFERGLDNVIGLIDTIPVIGLIGKGVKSLLKAGDSAKALVVGGSAPASIGKVTLETNPLKGSAMVDEAVKNDEVAKALFDTDSKGVAVEALGPKPMSSVNTVDPLPSHPSNVPEGDKGVIEALNKDGQINYTDAEKANASLNVETAFQKTVNLNYRSELSQIGHEDGLQIKAVYTAGETGFSSARDAMDQVKFALKDFGIKDTEISILKRGEEGYVKMSGGVTDDVGDYIVQVDYKTKVNPNDVTNWSELDVKNNFMDRVGILTGNGSQGSLTRHLLDAHSVLNPTLTMSANVVVDKGSLITRRITDLGEDFGNAFRKMDDPEKLQVENYIKTANKDGLEHTPAQLMGQGFTPKAVEALTSWRKSWDTVYWLENADLVRTLKSSGYKGLKTDTDNLFVRKTQMNFENNRVYNPETKQVQTLLPDEIRALYDNGGYVGQARSRMNLDGEDIGNVLVKNDSKSYATGLRETDPILNYRKGYYQVNYDAPRFIDKIVKDKNGKELYRKAIGMARDNVEANLMLSKFAKAEGMTTESFGVVRENKQGVRISADDHWDMQNAQGRTSQRVRGERLQEATQPLTGGIDGTLVQDPIDALAHAARSIGNRVSMRDWLESSKTRFVSQYGDYLTEVNGQKKFPRSISDLGKVGDTTSSQIADARTTWEYINYMEGGYVNSIDDTLKGTMRAIGNIMGNAGYGKTQRGMEWMASGKGITGMAKGTAFQLYLALNPLRQILVQSHQMVRLAAINPQYALTKMTTQLAAVQGARLTGKSNDLHKFVMDSGQIDSISRSNLLQDSLTEITHHGSQGALGKTKAAATKVTKVSQKVGFEFGESNNVITSLLSFRDQAIKAGKDINNATVRDEIYAQSRNFTYNMTKAGDMPYNQNSLGIIMQFLQVPHKAITQSLFNRALTKPQRASALMFDTVMFGVPAYWAADKWFGDVLPEDPKLREALEIGIEGMMLNAMLNTVTDEHSELDYTSLAPTSAQGFADLFTRSTEEGIFALVSKSPSGQLVFGTNPRITNMVKNIAIFSGAMPDYSSMEFSTLAKQFVSMSSGMSNAFKMRFAQKYGKVINSSESVVEETVTSAEAIGILFGLPPKDVAGFYKTTDKMYKKTKAFQDDIKAHYKEVKRQLALAGDDKESSEKVLEAFAAGWLVFGDDEVEARTQFASLIKRDAKEGDLFLIEKMFKLSGIMTPSEWNILIQDAPIEDEKKKELLSIGKQLENYKAGED